MGKICFNHAVGQYQLGSETMIGFAFVRIRSPANLHIPFLSVKLAEGSAYALCTACAKKKNQKSCRHKEKARDIYTTLIWPEIVYAVTELNYELISIFEVYQYSHCEPIFKNFMRLLSHSKLKYSVPDGPVDEYCEKNNSAMNFPPNLKLEPENVTPCKEKREYYKQDLNMLLGKFAQKNDITQSVIVRSQSALTDLFYSKKTPIIDLFAYKKACQVITKRITKNRTNRSANCTIYGYVVGLSRVFMHKEMVKLQLAQCKIFSVHNDALYFTKPKNIDLPFIYSNIFGSFKKEYPYKILSYISLGNKSSGIKYINEDKQEICELKARGFSLKSSIVSDIISFSKVEQMLTHKYPLLLPQIRHKNNIETGSLKESLSYMRLTSDIRTNRVLLASLETVPYGYKQ